MEKYTTMELMDLLEDCHTYDGSFEDIYCYLSNEIGEILYGLDIANIMDMVYYGNYNPNYEYFRFDGYGNIESVDYYGYKEEVEDRAEEIIEHAKRLGFID